MSSNLDYVVCPKCTSLNAAVWQPMGQRSYTVTCSVCGFEHEHGHYASQRHLTLEEFMRGQQEDQAERDLVDDTDEGEPGIWDTAHLEMLKRIYGEYWE